MTNSSIIPLLLVEDNRMDIELTLDAFREARFPNPIQVATGGQMALDYLFGHGVYADRQRYPLPGLILLDLKMPVVDGYEVLRQLKGTPILKRIPIVIMTSSSLEGDRILSYDIGANSYLVKPLTFEGFMDVVKTIGGYWLNLNLNAPDESENG
jgi:CheY-like chemotaxis protein